MIRDRLRNRYILWAGIAAALAGFLLFNGSFRATVIRIRAIHTIQREYTAVSAEVDQLKSKISTLESNPQAREDLVRRDLGYIRPGEKEIHFVPSAAKEK